MIGNLQTFGSWLAGQRWYVDELLAPAPDPWMVAMQGYPFSIRQLPATVRYRYLNRPLADVLGSTPTSYADLYVSLMGATQCIAELRLDVDSGRPVCREMRLLAAEVTSELTRIPSLPLDALVGRYLRTWYSRSPRPIQRRKFTPAILQSVALVYRANPKRPAQAVAEYHGWRSKKKMWTADSVGRARASRAISVAREEGYLRKAPGTRRKGEEAGSG